MLESRPEPNIKVVKGNDMELWALMETHLDIG